MPLHKVIAIDGPAASGKSTIARGVARALGFLYVDTGSMYRAMAWKSLQDKVDLASREAILEWLPTIVLEATPHDRAIELFMNGQHLEDAWLRAAEVNHTVSPIAAVPEIRNLCVVLQRSLKDDDDIVAEGRDMGTVVFPDTRYKFYIDASPDVREMRRQKQGYSDAILHRDKLDSTRSTAPLKVAEDAIVVDSSHMTPQENIEVVLKLIHDMDLGK